MSAAAGTESSVPRVIVVGPEQLHRALAGFANEWNAQDAVPDTAALWSAFASSLVDPSSPYIVFSTASASPAQVSGAIIAMLPSAKPLVLVESFDQLLPYQEAVAGAAASAGADASAVSWAASVHDLVSMLRGEITRAHEIAILAEAEAAINAAEPEITIEIPDAPAVKPFIAERSAPARPSLDQAFADDGSAAPTVPEVAPFSPTTSAFGTLIEPVEPPAVQGSAVDASPAPAPQPVAEPAPPKYEPPSFYFQVEPDPSRPVAPTPPPAPAAPAAAIPGLAPMNTSNAPTGPQDMIVGSPAAAHLPTLPVVADAVAGIPLAKTVPVPDKVPGQVTIAVTSSKGGSGKSTTALMLATTIAASSRAGGRPVKVALVDLDSRDGQVSTLIGTYLPTAFNLWTAPVWDATTVAASMVHSDDLGIDCLLAPARPRATGAIGTEFYRHVIHMLQSMYDVVILDTAANYLDGAAWEVALREANSILLVTTLANTAIQGMSRAVRDMTDPVDVGGLGIPREQLAIVVNQSVAGVGIDMEFIVQAALHVPIVAAVPMATRDVLLATNHSAMQALLKHPYLGPAYFGLARAVLPHLVLLPLVATATETPRPDVPAAQNSSATGDDTSARETRTTPGNGIQSEQTPSNGSAVGASSVETVPSILGS